MVNHGIPCSSDHHFHLGTDGTDTCNKNIQVPKAHETAIQGWYSTYSLIVSYFKNVKNYK